jgi:type I restriction enzyme S subunit
LLLLLSPNGRTQIEEISKSTSGLYTLNLSKVAKLNVPTPTLTEQKEIVRRVESLFAKADAIEAKYNVLKTQIDNLPQAILAKAFKGELVEQLPTDGDAKELLKEIKKLKEASVPKKKVKRK